MTSVIVQARLDSSRLPQKAIAPFEKNTLLSFVLKNAKLIQADAYILACDYDSEEIFSPIAEACGFTCISGPKEDVLERFCQVIRKTGTTKVIRITGDNPFIFVDAAQYQLEVFNSLLQANKDVDYFTFVGLPHGSGVEIFLASSVLQASIYSSSPYEREHVGPALYNHPEHFNCIKEKAPDQWFFPEVRTTIDTSIDYERSKQILQYCSRNALLFPFSSKDILKAWNYVEKKILFIPSTQKGRGTGHLVRAINIIEHINEQWNCLLYIPRSSSLLFEVSPLIQNSVIRELPEKAHLVVLDFFATKKHELNTFRKIGPIVAIDEGGFYRNFCSFLFDIIPGKANRFSKPNISNPAYIDLPVNRKKQTSPRIKNVLVLAGGENAKGLAEPYAKALVKLDYEVTLLDASSKTGSSVKNGYTITGAINNLKEKLEYYDLVVTHYGFTAFEAIAASCKVILFSPSWYHYFLGKKFGFSTIAPKSNPEHSLSHIIVKGIKSPSVLNPETKQLNLPLKIEQLAQRQYRFCPLCDTELFKKVLFRSEERTIVMCSHCKMVYQTFQVDPKIKYSKSYFFEEYKNQYGKTYLEDFETIKKMGEQRLASIQKVLDIHFSLLPVEEKKLLDIGCAYGPFLQAAQEAGWQPFGTDVSEDAIKYVNSELGIPAYCASFPALDKENKIRLNSYACITMWYVIEHIEGLDAALGQVSNLLIPGGIFAFSSPSISGISALSKKRKFYEQSPSDHLVLLNPRTILKQLKLKGFLVKKIKSTGHHPERFPFCSNLKPQSLLWKLLNQVSHVLCLGDTFEVYAIKRGRVEDYNE